MDEPIRILIVEDVPADAELAQREINRDCRACTYRVVDTREGFLDALETFSPDLIVSDYSLPTFDGMTALTLTLERTPSTPLIIVTGSQNEDIAVGCIKAGAADYVLKDSIKRLGPAVIGALELKRARQEKERAEGAIRESERRYRELVENIADIVYVTDQQGRFTFLNGAAEQAIGYPRETILGRDFTDFLTPESLETAARVFRRQRAGEDVGIFEVDAIDSSGVKKTIETREKLVWDGDRIVAFQGIGRDITQRKRAEEALRALSVRHMAILRAVSDIIMEVDADKVYTWANQAGFEFFGEDVIGKEASFYFEGEQDTYLSTQPLFDGSEDVFYVESWQRRRNGEKRLLGWWCRALKDENGKVTGALSSARDITERNAAEEALKESEKRYHSLFSNMLEGYAYCRMILDGNNHPVDFVYLDVNDSFERLTGLKDVVGKQVTEVIPSIREMNPELFEIYGRVALTGKTERFEVDFKPLAQWLSVSVYSVETGYFVAVFDNITERKRAEEALRESEERLRLAYDAAKASAWEWDIKTNKNTWSDEIWVLYGLEPGSGEPSYELWAQAIHPEDRPAAEAAVRNAARSGTELNAEWRVNDRNGPERWLMSRGQPQRDESGQVVRYRGIVIDITERKRAEEALRESEERYRNLLDLAPVGIAVQSEGKIVFSNSAGAQIIGAKSPEEVIGREIAKIIHPDRLEEAQERIKRMLSGEQGLYPAENVYVRLDGTPVPVDVIATPITYQGRPAVQVIVTDIGKRKEAEQAIRESEQRYRELVENIDDIMYVTDGTGKMIFLNRALERISGYTRQELLQKNYMDLLTPESLRKVIELFKTQKKGKDIGLFEISIVDKDGRVKVIEAREQMIREGDRIVQMRGLGRDITERKRAEERIYHLNRVLESIRNIDQLIVRVEDRDTLLTGACEILSEVSGYYFVWIGLASEEDKRVVPAAYWGFEDGYLEDITVTWDDAPTGQGPIGAAIRTRRPSVINDIAADPDFLPWRDTALERGYRSCIGIPIMSGERVYGALGVYSDLANIFDDEEASLLVEVAEDIAFALSSLEEKAERKRSEEALAESEQRYRSLVDNISIGIYRNTPGKKGNFIFCNRALLNMLGVSSFEEIKVLSPADFYQEPSEREAFSDNLLKTGSVSGVELRLRKLDGTLLWASVTARVVCNDRGEPSYFDCTLEDITERKKAEEAIRDSEEKFRDFFETSRDIVFITASDGTVLDINSAFEEILGYTRDETLLLNVTTFYKDPSDRGLFKKKIEAQGFVRDHELTLRKKDGTYADCLMTATTRRDEGGSIIGYQGTIRDITEKKRMERQLIQAEKLSSLGGILSGVAHELNNPLTSIIGISQLIMRKSTSEDIRDKLETIHHESLRTSKIIQGLLAFAREHKPERKMISVNKIIEESYRLREYEFKVDNIAIKLDLSEDIPLTAADPYQLQQVFINLINNSHDALVAGGGSALVIHSFTRDGSVAIEFEDDGPGISAENIGFIFDPFFTTKEVGKGTGLGLSIVYGIINEHGGRIDVVSEPGKGAKFTVSLPITKEIGKEVAPAKERARKPHTDRMVLVVEDEESLRKLIAEILDQDGYRAEGCADGEQAIKMLKLKRYDAIITDLKMPGIGGKELYTFVLKHYPELAQKVLFITGDVLNKDTQSFLKITGNIYIEKPFEIEVLLARIGEILER
jgi:PAS domain S-box-containing protein